MQQHVLSNLILTFDDVIVGSGICSLHLDQKISFPDWFIHSLVYIVLLELYARHWAFWLSLLYAWQSVFSVFVDYRHLNVFGRVWTCIVHFGVFRCLVINWYIWRSKSIVLLQTHLLFNFGHFDLWLSDFDRHYIINNQMLLRIELACVCNQLVFVVQFTRRYIWQVAMRWFWVVVNILHIIRYVSADNVGR